MPRLDDPAQRPRTSPWSSCVARIEEGEIDTVVVAFTDMQGRLQGKRLHGALLRRRRGRARHRGLQLPARRRRRHEHRRRLRDLLVGARATATWSSSSTRDTIRLLTHLPATAMVQCDLVWLDHSAGRAVAADDPAAAARPGAPSTGCVALAGTELEFIVFDTTYEAAPGPRLPRPDAGQPVQRRLLDPRHHPGRAAAARRSATRCTTPAWTSRAPRASATSASTRSASCYADALTTADNHAVYKTARQGDRRPAGQGRSPSWRSTTSARAAPATSTCRCAAPTASLVFWDGDGAAGRRSTTTSSPACSPRCATSRCSTRRTSTPTSGSPHGSFAPTDDRLGPRQPHLRRPAGRPRRRRADGEPGARRRREPLPRAGRACSPAACTASSTSWRSRTSWSATPTTPTSRRCRTRWREARDAFAASELARAAFGDEVVDHYTNMADVELAAFDAAVTDWELRRGFERL